MDYPVQVHYPPVAEHRVTVVGGTNYLLGRVAPVAKLTPRCALATERMGHPDINAHACPGTDALPLAHSLSHPAPGSRLYALDRYYAPSPTATVAPTDSGDASPVPYQQVATFYFRTGDSALTPAQQKALADLATTESGDVRIEGFADIRASDEFNLMLSAKRTEAVSATFPSATLVPKGETEAMARVTKEMWQDRRVDILKKISP